MTVFFSQLINGLSLGSIYALIALGYSMVYGIILLLNFATVVKVTLIKWNTCIYKILEC